jgi:hypothetical protein
MVGRTKLPLLTVVSIQLVPIVANSVSWRYVFLILAPGPLLGAVAVRRFPGRHDSGLNR